MIDKSLFLYQNFSPKVNGIVNLYVLIIIKLITLNFLIFNHHILKLQFSSLKDSEMTLENKCGNYR